MSEVALYHISLTLVNIPVLNLPQDSFNTPLMLGSSGRSGGCFDFHFYLLAFDFFLFNFTMLQVGISATGLL